jgi:hypothetical protein
MEINGVKIGDKFMQGKSNVCEVIDFYEIISLKTGSLVGHQCIAKNLNGLSHNPFQVPFSTVIRNRVYET